MEADVAPLTLGDLHLQATPRGKQRTDQQERPGAQLFIEQIVQNGGILVSRAVALQDGEIPLEPMLIDSQGYVVMLLLWGSAMVESEYVEAPHVVVFRPGGRLPYLHEGAEAIFISLGPVDVFDPGSRLRFNLSAVARMDLELKPSLRPHIGQSKRVLDQQPCDDVHFWVQSAGGGEEEARTHDHRSGGEVVLMLHGLLKDRGGWELGPYDVLVYGPNSRHGPRVGPQGAMALTLSLGTYTS